MSDSGKMGEDGPVVFETSHSPRPGSVPPDFPDAVHYPVQWFWSQHHEEWVLHLQYHGVDFWFISRDAAMGAGWSERDAWEGSRFVRSAALQKFGVRWNSETDRVEGLDLIGPGWKKGGLSGRE